MHGGLNIPVRAVSQVRLDVGFQVAQGEESFLAKCRSQPTAVRSSQICDYGLTILFARTYHRN